MTRGPSGTSALPPSAPDALPARRQPASAAGRWSRAGTVRSGCAPIVSNGAAVRFTQAVRIPAALAPTLSKALPVTRRITPLGTASRPAALDEPPGLVARQFGPGGAQREVERA